MTPVRILILVAALALSLVAASAPAAADDPYSSTVSTFAMPDETCGSGC